MEMPTITDWIQAVTALLALVLATISLVWQYRSSRAANELDVIVEASQFDEGVWSGLVIVAKPPRSEALSVKLKVLHPKSGRLFNPDDLPIETPESSYILRIPGPDFSKRDRLAKVKVLEQALCHQDAPSGGVAALFGLELPRNCEAARLHVSIFGADRRRPLVSRKMLISPIA